MDVGLSSLVSEAPGQLRVVELEERSWLGRHCRGDQSAFPALLTAYRRPVYSYLVRSGVAEAERDDLFQSIFLKIHAAAKSYKPNLPLAPWLFTIAANTAPDVTIVTPALGPSLRTKIPLPLDVDFHSVESPTIGAPRILRFRKFGR